MCGRDFDLILEMRADLNMAKDIDLVSQQGRIMVSLSIVKSSVILMWTRESCEMDDVCRLCHVVAKP